VFYKNALSSLLKYRLYVLYNRTVVCYKALYIYAYSLTHGFATGTKLIFNFDHRMLIGCKLYASSNG